MSLGFGVGDFLAVIELANKIRKDFAGAPNEFKGALDVYVAITQNGLLLMYVLIEFEASRLSSKMLK
jgi:hypothetical protein